MMDKHTVIITNNKVIGLFKVSNGWVLYYPQDTIKNIKKFLKRNKSFDDNIFITSGGTIVMVEYFPFSNELEIKKNQ